MTSTSILDVPDSQAIPATISLIGEAIQAAQTYFPLRKHAANLAATASPHDYMGMVQAIYDDINRTARYVRDPLDFEMLVTTGPEIMRHTLGVLMDESGEYVGRTIGQYDCDDITIALGALLLSIGIPVRIVTSSEHGSPNQWSHVFIQANVPGHGWTTVDPVLYPDYEFSATVPAARLGYWDLNGRNVANTSLAGISPYRIQLSGYTLPIETEPIFEMSEINCCADGIGTEIENMGYIGNANQFNVELGVLDYVPNGSGNAVTPILALQPHDFEYVSIVGCPHKGMRAVGNTGYVYEFVSEQQGLNGPVIDFFKKIGRAVGDFFRKIWDGVKKIFEATKFGRWILRVADGVVGFAAKILAPLSKVLGKLAPALAPVAALIPGVGPVVSAYLLGAGTIAQAYEKFGIPVVQAFRYIDGENVELLIPQFEEIDQVIALKSELLEAAKAMPDITSAELQSIKDELDDIKNMTDSELAQINEQMEIAGIDINTGGIVDPGTLNMIFEAAKGSIDRASQISQADKARIESYMATVNLSDPYGTIITGNIDRVTRAAERAALARAAYTANAEQAAAARAMYERANSVEARAAAGSAQAAATANFDRVQSASQAAAARAAAERAYQGKQAITDASINALQDIGYQIQIFTS